MFDLTSLPQKLKSLALAVWNADDKMLRWLLGGLIIILACFNYMRDLSNPNHGFWDEAYYVPAAERYLEGVAQYASHPPLGFMLMELGPRLSGANADLDRSEVAAVKKIKSTEVPKGYDYGPLRAPAALFSVVSCLLFFLILLRLLDEPFEAFVFSLLFIFDNGFIVHLRAGHLDAYQITFSLGAILVWLFTFGREPKRPLLTYAAFGTLCALSFMVKVNSLPLTLLAGMSLARGLWTSPTRAQLVDAAKRGASAFASFLAVIAAVFTLHVVANPVAPDPGTESGRRDLRYMGETYKGWLNGERGLGIDVILDATYGYYDFMHNDFVGVTKTEANGSQPIMWPFMQRIISYRWDSDGTKTAYVQMVGNPLTWGIGSACILGGLVLILRRRVLHARNSDGEDMNRLEAVWGMFMIFWVFHMYLGTPRVMYIYHYFLGLLLLYMCAGLIFRIMARRLSLLEKHRFSVLCGLAASVAGVFLFYAPLTYHQKITREACEWRNIPFKAVVCQPIAKPTDARP